MHSLCLKSYDKLPKQLDILTNEQLHALKRHYNAAKGSGLKFNNYCNIPSRLFLYTFRIPRQITSKQIDQIAVHIGKYISSPVTNDLKFINDYVLLKYLINYFLFHVTYSSIMIIKHALKEPQRDNVSRALRDWIESRVKSLRKKYATKLRRMIKSNDSRRFRIPNLTLDATHKLVAPLVRTLESNCVRLELTDYYIDGYYYNDRLLVTNHWRLDFDEHIRRNSPFNDVTKQRLKLHWKHGNSIFVFVLESKQVGRDLAYYRLRSKGKTNKPINWKPTPDVLFDCVVSYHANFEIVNYLNKKENYYEEVDDISQRYVDVPGVNGPVIHISLDDPKFHCGSMYLRRGVPRALLHSSFGSSGRFGFERV